LVIEGDHRAASGEARTFRGAGCDLPAIAIFASNTSSLTITEIATATKRRNDL